MLKEKMSASRSNTSDNKAGRLGKIIVVLLFIVLVGACVWLFINYNNAQKQVDYFSNLTPEEMNEKATNELLEKVGKLIVLPNDQEPIVSTIQDIDELAKDQPFFKDAQNGDKVIVYKDRAIIYSLTKNILINVGPVYTQENEEEADNQNKNENSKINKIDTQPVEKNITLEIRNGSETAGLAAELKNKLSAEKNYKVISVNNATRKNYNENILVNLNGKDVSKLEEELGTQAINFLPEGEVQSVADVVIILGNKK